MTVDRRSLGLAVLCLFGCRSGPAPAPVIRLVDQYQPRMVEAVAPTKPRPRTEWLFSDGTTRGWDAAYGVEGLAVRDGRLTGRASSDFPLLHVERHPSGDEGDLLYEVQVRARVSAGTRMDVSWSDSPKPDFPEIVERARDLPWLTTTPIVAGDETTTYTLRCGRPVTGSGLRHLLLRPTDAAHAGFAIESVRLVFRREHLAQVPSGVSWQGLSEIYHETLVSRAPETLRMDLRVPADPRLDLALGTPDDQPVTFEIDVREPGGGERRLLERTLTRPHHWQDVTLDLAGYAGRDVSLTLALRSEVPGTLGFWGAPVLRRRGTLPVTGAKQPPFAVIVIWADTLRRDHLGAYGYARPTSPAIDRLAAEGVLFKDCVGQASWTKVATPSMMTSLYPTTHGVKDFADRISAQATTLAEVYRSGGYATLSFSSILFTGRFTNLHQGFEVVHEDGSLADQESSKTARDYVDRLLGWVDTHRDVPFFAFLHVSDPHDPYKPHAPYDTMWADPARVEEHKRQAKEVRRFVADPLMKRFGMPTRQELARAGFDPQAFVDYDRDWYDGSIRGMDAEIGRLIEGLDGAGLRGKALVVFTGDHGEEFLEHGRMFHGQSVYGEMNNVPLVLWRPGAVPSGRVVDETVQMVDLMPTLLEMSGLPTPKEAQGQSLLSLLTPPEPGGAVRAASLPARVAISEKAAITNGGGPPPRDTAAVAAIEGGWKLIHHTKRPDGQPEFELFDHRRDPLDAHDVAADHPEVVQRLTKALAVWKRRAEAARLPTDDSAHALKGEELERLRALGYVQ